MYASDLTVDNRSGEFKTYHVEKAETLNVPISGLTVNGLEFPYRVERGFLRLDARVPPSSSIRIVIRYGK